MKHPFFASFDKYNPEDKYSNNNKYVKRPQAIDQTGQWRKVWKVRVRFEINEKKVTKVKVMLQTIRRKVTRLKLG